MADFSSGFLYSDSDHHRLTAEPGQSLEPEPYRSPYRKDFARLLHSPAFRRLQGKTQLFPGHESDFFRNRLTHSLEVAQIAKSIAIRLNDTAEPFCLKPTRNRDWRISTDLVEFAGLAHDLGHPPFGHNGEAALDRLMVSHGGFEGNAQTLRVLARLEKKRLKNGTTTPLDMRGGENRVGLNLTYRSLASVLKYDREIRARDEGSDLVKGYYSSERSIVRGMKEAVVGRRGYSEKFKTIECWIMDLADDIAYSTYDIEDSLKAGFLSLLDFLTLESQEDLFNKVAKKIWNRTKPASRRISSDADIPERYESEFVALKKQIMRVLINTIAGILVLSNDKVPKTEVTMLRSLLAKERIEPAAEAILIAYIYQNAQEIQRNGYIRTDFTSKLVGQFIRNVEVEVNSDIVPLSKVMLDSEQQIRLEAIKNYTYEAHIMSPRLKVAEYRGQEFVSELFEAIRRSKKGYLLMPKDWQNLYLQSAKADDDAWLDRVVCDYIAGMTDRYALELYGRLKSENPQTIFKDH